MGSSRPTDRSLGEATFLPQWMKGKLESRFDYTESTFSPPADDTFFYIRYPKQDSVSSTTASTTTTSSNSRPISEIVGNKTGSDSSAALRDNSKNLDYSKHPLPCQPFIPFTADKVHEPKIVIANRPKVKHDDEFNAKVAECGRSIVHVANQIMSNKLGKSNSSDSSEPPIQQQGLGSRSLPATPLASPAGTPDSSPRSRRRAYGNRFFTGAFVPDVDQQQQQHHHHNQQQRPKNGWLLSSILGQSREMITHKIEEEEDESGAETIPARALSRKKSISSQNLTYFGKDDKSEKSSSSIVNGLRPRPSELREMNFWTPTSM